MYYGKIKDCDIADGPGVRVTLFVSGCTNACEGCFQPETWDFHHGEPFTDETVETILRLMKRNYIAGLTILGGEPMEPRNQKDVLALIRRVRETYPRKTIWSFSGFTWEELMTEGAYPHTEVTREILENLDVLVDGRFILAQRDLMLRFRGSRNQRLLDMPRTLAEGRPVIWQDADSNGLRC